MNWTHHSCNYRVSCCCTLCSYSSLKFKQNKWFSKKFDTCNYRFANTYLWERNTTSRYINCKRLFHSEKKVCYMVYTSLVLFFLVTFGDIVVIDPIVSLLRYYCRWEDGIWDLLRSLNLCHPKTPWTSLLITLSGRFYVNSPVNIAVTASPLLQVLTCINYSVTCVHFRFYLYLFTSTMSHMDIFAWMYMYIWVQRHTFSFCIHCVSGWMQCRPYFRRMFLSWRNMLTSQQRLRRNNKCCFEAGVCIHDGSS